MDGLLPHSPTLDSHGLYDPVISDFIQSLYDVLTTYLSGLVPSSPLSLALCGFLNVLGSALPLAGMISCPYQSGNLLRLKDSALSSPPLGNLCDLPTQKHLPFSDTSENSSLS